MYRFHAIPVTTRAWQSSRAVKPARPKYQRHRGTGFARPLEASPLGGKARSATGGGYFNQPRLRKYHMGPRALATIRPSA